jgi:hypothetical protein
LLLGLLPFLLSALGLELLFLFPQPVALPARRLADRRLLRHAVLVAVVFRGEKLDLLLEWLTVRGGPNLGILLLVIELLFARSNPPSVVGAVRNGER